MRIVCFLSLGLVVATNLNGLYSVASGVKQDVPFDTDYAPKGMEYFDVYSTEIASHYAQVFWADQGQQPLPPDIVKRFAGKTIAITGYEHDQVMVTPQGQPGVNPDLDVSVPINWVYNHHYSLWVLGQNADMMTIPAAKNDPEAHGMLTKLVAFDRPSSDPEDAKRLGNGLPTSQWFSEGNGGESRKSFHGYPKGYAQLVDLPVKWDLTPMQIDIRNRECGVTPKDVGNCTGAPGNPYRPGPEPRQARWARPLDRSVGSNYSGVLECPCNGRWGGDPQIYGNNTLTKQIIHHIQTVPAGCPSGQGLTTADRCFDAVAALGLQVKANQTVTRADLPNNCFVQTTGSSNVAIFNTAGQAPCALSPQLSGSVEVSATGVGVTVVLDISNSTATFSRSKKGVYCSENRENILSSFVPPTDSKDDALIVLQKCEAYCATNPKCWGCSVDLIQPPALARWNAIPVCGNVLQWDGKIDGDISEKVPNGTATITLTGPAGVWFGVGFNAMRMADEPWTLVCNDTVFEQKIGTCGDEGQHCPGTPLNRSVQVLSNTVSGGVRTVVVRRPIAGLTKDHYSFNPTHNASIDLLTAVGNSLAFAYHAKHALGSIAMTNTNGQPTCMCDIGYGGILCDQNGQGCTRFIKDCIPEPASDLLVDANPTCDSIHYVGGLTCCGHLRIMLDADQDPGDVLLRYHMKYRFWFQEYTPATNTTPASHYNLDRIYYQTESNAGEYDIPPAFAKPGVPTIGYPNWPLNTMTPGTTCTGTCPDGPDCDCVHTIHYLWTVPQMRLIYAGGHCHAPSCIGMWLYRNDTGEMLCAQIPKYGNATDKFGEYGFLALPPCLWGDDYGLNPSFLLPEGTPLLSIKKNHNTNQGHTGEMASWQMRGTTF